MSREIRMTVRAKRDVSRIEAFLISKSPEAARRAVNAISEAVRSLADHADRGHQALHPGLKQIPVVFGNSGYVIQYRVSAHDIVIARIKHALERP